MCVPADPLNANQPLRELSLNGVKLFEKNLDLLTLLKMVKFMHSLAEIALATMISEEVKMIKANSALICCSMISRSHHPTMVLMVDAHSLLR